MLIRWTPKKAAVWCFGLKGHAGGSLIKIMPGVNEIANKIWNEEMKDHPTVIERLATKEVEVIDESEPKESESGESTSLSNLSAKDAIEAVEECWDPDLLDKWSKAEERVTVSKAIDKQIKKIKDHAQPSNSSEE